MYHHHPHLVVRTICDPHRSLCAKETAGQRCHWRSIEDLGRGPSLPASHVVLPASAGARFWRFGARRREQSWCYYHLLWLATCCSIVLGAGPAAGVPSSTASPRPRAVVLVSTSWSTAQHKKANSSTLSIAWCNFSLSLLGTSWRDCKQGQQPRPQPNKCRQAVKVPTEHSHNSTSASHRCRRVGRR